MSHLHVCEPCRKALDLPADKSYLRRIKRKSDGLNASGKPTSVPALHVVKRDETGKPWLLGHNLETHSVAFPASCGCRCTTNNHDPHECTGEGDFIVGGRPGSGAVDAKAKAFGMEPTPEMVASMHEEVATTVRVLIAWLSGGTDEERLQLENSLNGPGVGYTDQLKQLRDLLNAKMPTQAAAEPYTSLKPNLKKLAKFRNDKASHSWPVGGDWLTRMKRVNGEWTTFTVTAEEVAEHMDLAFALLSQLSFIPHYVLKPANDNPEAVQQLIDWVEGTGAGFGK